MKYLFLAAAVLLTACAQPASQREGRLARAAQNPLADLASLRLRNNANLDWGPGDDLQNVLDIQSVVPFRLNDGWELISRASLPLIDQPVPGKDDMFGLGDATFTTFFSPADGGEITWGLGPVLLLPTSTSRKLGPGEWGGGLSAAALAMNGPWVVGGLARHVWSFESSATDTLLLHPFVNYNFDNGCYLVTAPILTADWEASSGERWTIPVGGGMGKVFAWGAQAIDVNVQYYDNVESPTLGSEWQLRLQLQLLFPED